MLFSWLAMIVLGALGGIGKAIRDTIAFNWTQSIFNRIKNDRLRRWFQSTGERPNHLIWFLWDGWHFGDTLSYASLLTAMFFVAIWHQIPVCAVMFGAIFQLFFHWFFLSKEK
jgi:hypothetical protein